MRYRSFGTTGLGVSEIGLGCSRLGGLFSTDSSQRSEIRLVRDAVDAGVTFFDTADAYSQGQSEILLGTALKGRRDAVVLATKGGFVWPANRRVLARVKPLARPFVRLTKLDRRRGGGAAGAGGPAGPPAQDFSPAHLAAAVEGSLRRLKTDVIDVYQLHSPARSVIEAGDYVAVLEGLRDQGKIRVFGIAAERADDAAGFRAVPEVELVQVPFNLIERSALETVFPTASQRGTAVISRSCFAAGLLREGRSPEELARLTPDWEEITRMQAAARRIGRPILEAALQYSLGRRPIVVTIVGMWKPSQLTANLRYAEAAPLEPAELEAFAEVAAMATADGPIGRDTFITRHTSPRAGPGSPAR